ncbi:unnamed protein product [Cyprideis torosa]|uniref:Uncharacterized protein n=1 Tax=Cyprideis torosa TaxID=163714 RepID=A0A7R8ZUJ5_9CRUS|nr:unnamed protein product [Cyprideis torosa]CAG0906153.1 unnamed protein product [Cyprideis torosa]
MYFSSSQAPVWNLRVHVHCGRNLKPKQTGGSGDPLCDIVLLPLQKQRFRTRSCPKTLNPEWNQQVVFSDVNLEQDSLLILVSDHLSEASPLRDRIKQIEEVRSPSGLTRYFKNVAHAVKPSGGQSSEPFAVMGKLHISLQDIPAGRSRAWYALEGRSKQNPKDGGPRKEAKLKAGKGDIDVTTELGTFASDNQDERLDIQSLKLLWVILVKFELSLFKGASDVWHGRLSRESELILRQYEAVTGYSPTEASVASWLALWEVYQEQPLDFGEHSSLNFPPRHSVPHPQKTSPLP